MGKEDDYVSDDDNSEDEEEEECPECGIVFNDLSELATHYFHSHKEKKANPAPAPPAPAPSTPASSGAPAISSATPASIPVRKYQVESIQNRASQQNSVTKEEKLNIPSDQFLASSAPKNKPYSYVAQRISSNPLPNKPPENSSNASAQTAKLPTSAQMPKPIMSAQMAKPPKAAQTAKPPTPVQTIKLSTSAQTAKLPMSAQMSKPIMSAEMVKPSISAQTAKSPISAQTPKSPHTVDWAALTAKPPNFAQTTKTPTSVQIAKPSTPAQTAKPPMSAPTVKPPTSIQTAKPPMSAQMVKPPTSAQSAKPPTSSQMVKPPMSAQTAKPPTSAQTAKPPMSTQMAKPPTSAQMAKPPTPAQMAKPPTPAQMAKPPTPAQTVKPPTPAQTAKPPTPAQTSTITSKIPSRPTFLQSPKPSPVQQPTNPLPLGTNESSIPTKRSTNLPPKHSTIESSSPSQGHTKQTKLQSSKSQPIPRRSARKQSTEPPAIPASKTSPIQNRGMEMIIKNMFGPQISKENDDIVIIEKNETNDGAKNEIVEKDLKDAFDDPEDTSVTPSEDLGTYENMLARYIQENDLPFIPRFRNRSDGNCWYEAIADQIDLHDIPDFPREHVGLRQAICDALLNLPQSNSWIKNLFGGKKKRFYNFVEKHRKDGEWTDAKGLVCQATALLLKRKIHIVGTANMNQPVCYTKLESVPEADDCKPLIVGYYQDKHYQSLESIESDFVSEAVPEDKNIDQVKVDELKQNQNEIDTQNVNENAPNVEELETQIKIDELKQSEDTIKCVPRESPVKNGNREQNVKLSETHKLEGSTKSVKPQGKVARDPIKSKPLRKKSASSGKMVRTPIVSQVPRKQAPNRKDRTEDIKKKESPDALVNKDEDKVNEKEFNNEGEVENKSSYYQKTEVPVLSKASAIAAPEETSPTLAEKTNKAVEIPDDAKDLIEAIRISVNNVNKKNSPAQTLIETEDKIFKAKSSEAMEIEKRKKLEAPSCDTVEEKVNAVIETDQSKESQTKPSKNLQMSKPLAETAKPPMSAHTAKQPLSAQAKPSISSKTAKTPETVKAKPVESRSSQRLNSLRRKGMENQNDLLKNDENVIGQTKLETPNFKIARKNDSTQKKDIIENGEENLISPTKLETPNFKITRKNDSTKKVITENKEDISVVLNTNNNLSPDKKDATQTLKNVKVSKVKSVKKPQLSIVARRKQLNGAASKIQTWYKHAHRGLVERRNFLRTREAAIKIQSYWRSFRTRNVIAKTRAAILLQSQWRSLLVRKQFLKKRKAASLVQKLFRTTKSGKVDRKAFLRKKKAAIAIQTRWRRWLGLANGPMFQLLPPDEHYINPETGELQLMDDYIINPETGEMEKAPVDLPQYLNRNSGFLDFTKLSSMAVKSWKKSKLKVEVLERFQSQVPQYKIIKPYKREEDVKDCNEVELADDKIISVTLKPPKTLDSKGNGGKWDKIEQQKETFGGILCETSLWKKPFNIVAKSEVQSDSDNNNDDSFEDFNHEESSFNRLLEGLLNSSKDFSNIVSSDKMHLSKPPDYLRFGNFRSSELECINTSWLESRIELRRQSLRNKSAITIQSCWRGHAARKNWAKSKNSAITIQKWIRNIKERNSSKEMARVEMEAYARKKSAAKLLQSRWRVWIVAKKARRSFLSLKNAAVTMQSHWRGLQGRRRSAAVKAKRDAPKLLLFSTFHEDSSSDEETSGSLPSSHLKRKAKTSPETQPKKKSKQEEDNVDDKEPNLRRSSRTRTLTKS